MDLQEKRGLGIDLIPLGRVPAAIDSNPRRMVKTADDQHTEQSSGNVKLRRQPVKESVPDKSIARSTSYRDAADSGVAKTDFRSRIPYHRVTGPSIVV
jgi:hypothetical protein